MKISSTFFHNSRRSRIPRQLFVAFKPTETSKERLQLSSCFLSPKYVCLHIFGLLYLYKQWTPYAGRPSLRAHCGREGRKEEEKEAVRRGKKGREGCREGGREDLPAMCLPLTGHVSSTKELNQSIPRCDRRLINHLRKFWSATNLECCVTTWQPS